MASSTAAAATTTDNGDDTSLQVGDLVVATDKIWAESQTFLHFMRRQTGSRIPLSRGAVFRVSDVIHSSGDFILNLANVFDEATPNGDGEDGHARQLLRSESLIFCSKGDEKKLQVLERASAEAAADTQAEASNTDDDAAEGSDIPQGNEGSHDDEDNADGEVNHQSDDDDEEEDPMLLMGSAPYQDIVQLLYRGLDLPIDVAKHMTKFLQIKDIVKNEVLVTRASSTRGDYPLSSVLGNEDGTWWISAEGSMESGQGEEYLEFSLSRTGVARRCSYVGLSIPPLPQGPLSVRKFRIDWSYDGKEWTEGCRRYTMETMDMAGMQSFKLEQPIDAAKVRLISTTYDDEGYTTRVHEEDISLTTPWSNRGKMWVAHSISSPYILDIYFGGQYTDPRPSNPLISFDLSEYLEEPDSNVIFCGFSASTGGESSIQEIVRFTGCAEIAIDGDGPLADEGPSDGPILLASTLDFPPGAELTSTNSIEASTIDTEPDSEP